MVLKDKIGDQTTKLRTTFGVDFDLPSNSKDDLEWTGLDLIRPTVSHIDPLPTHYNIFSQPRMSDNVIADTFVKHAASTPFNQPESLFQATNQGHKSSTPQSIEREATLGQIKTTINNKIFDGRYVENSKNLPKPSSNGSTRPIKIRDYHTHTHTQLHTLIWCRVIVVTIPMNKLALLETTVALVKLCTLVGHNLQLTSNCQNCHLMEPIGVGLSENLKLMPNE